MKTNPIYYFFAGVFLVCTSHAAEPPSDIAPAQKRNASVELAERLAAVPTSENIQIPDDVKNPFDSLAGIKIEQKVGRPTTDKELLAILADQLHPTGVMGREESLILLLKGQKGVKLNEKLTLSFDGAAYDVEVTSIDHNSFSLRYNQAEITRPIK
jgi:hypothetical protein